MLPKIMSRSPIVQKYGGSSVASIDRLRSIAEKIAQRSLTGEPVVVVVSAMGKQTSQLLALAEEARESSGSSELPERELDMLVSTGERVTMALLSIILNGLGRPAISLTGSQSGIITTDTHFNSRVIEVRPHRIVKAAQQGSIVVVAGYQGMSKSGEITTLGRGGSDTTAVALASALNASACEIYSDVDGVYSSDPRRVPGALHLPVVGYDFIWTMSHAGARVLNREAIQIAKESGIPILARSTFDATSAETKVIADERAPACRAVVEHEDIMVIEAAHDRWLPLLRRSQEVGMELLDAHRTASGFRCWTPQGPLARRELARHPAAGLASTTDLSLVSLVGPGAATFLSLPQPAEASTPALPQSRSGNTSKRKHGSPTSEHLALVSTRDTVAQNVVHHSELRVSALLPKAQARTLTQELHRLFAEPQDFRRSA